MNGVLLSLFLALGADPAAASAPRPVSPVESLRPLVMAPNDCCAQRNWRELSLHCRDCYDYRQGFRYPWQMPIYPPLPARR